jgi:uncharacterized damage-inducible protein DinB
LAATGPVFRFPDVNAERELDTAFAAVEGMPRSTAMFGAWATDVGAAAASGGRCAGPGRYASLSPDLSHLHPEQPAAPAMTAPAAPSPSAPLASAPAPPAPPSPSPTSPSLARLAFGDLDHELATTRRVLDRVPDAHFGFRPHPKSMSLGELAAHLANVPTWGVMTLSTPELDLARPLDAGGDRSGTRDRVLAHFDRGAAAFRAALADASDAALRERWAVRRGQQVVSAMPRAAALRGMVVNHMIHHRGQLSVYLRLLDLPVPSIYGPSADEARA